MNRLKLKLLLMHGNFVQLSSFINNKIIGGTMSDNKNQPLLFNVKRIAGSSHEVDKTTEFDEAGMSMSNNKAKLTIGKYRESNRS